MHARLWIMVALLALAPLLAATPAAAGMGRYEVYGVEGEEMLKLRGGPGIGYIAILGLPKGTVLRVHSCQQTGGTRWCSVSLDMAPRIKGHVSWAYLRKL